MVQISYATAGDTSQYVDGYHVGQSLQAGRVIALVVGEPGELVDVITSSSDSFAAANSALHGARVIILDGKDISEFTTSEFNILVKVHSALADHNDARGITDYILA